MSFNSSQCKNYSMYYPLFQNYFNAMCLRDGQLACYDYLIAGGDKWVLLVLIYCLIFFYNLFLEKLNIDDLITKCLQ